MKSWMTEESIERILTMDFESIDPLRVPTHFMGLGVPSMKKEDEAHVAQP